ncbi:MAG: hypothetical protein R6W92_02855, partial [Desulfocurvibacter africanus]
RAIYALLSSPSSPHGIFFHQTDGRDRQPTGSFASLTRVDRWTRIQCASTVRANVASMPFDHTRQSQFFFHSLDNEHDGALTGASSDFITSAEQLALQTQASPSRRLLFTRLKANIC